MSSATGQRDRATVAGLCAGDAASWTSWWHRLAQLPPRRSVRLGEAVQHSQRLAATSLPTPYLQSSSPDLIDAAGPTDDTEWFVVAVRHHLGRLLDGAQAGPGTGVWAELAGQRAADDAAVRGRLGTVLALDNLAAGLSAPRSGYDNPHYFDDIACVRAVAAGLLRPADPSSAADLAAEEASITHALDGVDGARATAALIAALLGGQDPGAAIAVAVDQLPEAGWCAHVVDEALAVTRPAQRAWTLAARLEREVVDHVYAYANQAPETLGLLLAHLSTASSGDELMLGALAHPRHADALVPLAGAVAGAAFGGETGELPVLTGTCVRALAGVALEDVLADLRVHAARPASAEMGEGR